MEKNAAFDSSISVLLTIHNEEDKIKKRIKNLFDSAEEHDHLEIIVASDGSTDRTDAIVIDAQNTNNHLRLFTTSGGGKSFTQVKAIEQAQGEIIIITDAETVFQRDTILNLIRPFADPGVGCTTGRLVLADGKSGVSQSQGFYWRYEMLLRKLESRAGLLHTATGSVMAFRKSLFKPFEPKYGDDCAIPLDIVSQGYRVIHADDAVAYDDFPSTMKGELKARIRMTLRNITCTLNRRSLLNPFKHPLISWAIISHKLLRWLTPYFLLLLFISNMFLLDRGGIYVATFWAQVAFYVLGFAGYLAERRGSRIPLASQAFSFILANIGFFLGVFLALLGRNMTSYRNVKGATQQGRHA